MFQEVLRFFQETELEWIEIGDCVKDYMSVWICIDNTLDNNSDRISEFGKFMYNFGAMFGNDYNITTKNMQCCMCDNTQHEMVEIHIEEQPRITEVIPQVSYVSSPPMPIPGSEIVKKSDTS